WDDENEDGVLTPGEDRRFEGVTVELRDANGALIATTETDADGNYAFVNLPFGTYTVVVTDIANMTGGFRHTDGAAGANNNSQNDQGYQVILTPANPIDNTGDFGYRSNISTPITLASFAATAGDYAGQIKFVWTTETEVGNIGFRLFAKVNDAWVEINDSLIPAAGDSIVLQRYEYQTDELYAASEFVLVDVDLYGDQVLHGPFKLGQKHGLLQKPTGAALSGELKSAIATPAHPVQKSKPDEATRSQRKQRESDAHQRRLDRLLNRPLSSLGAWLLGALVSNAEAAPAFTLADFEVKHAGVYEVKNSDLLAAGIDIQGFDIDQLGLFSQQESVPLEVLDDGDGLFNGSDSLRFIGKKWNTLYAGTNIYKLQLDGAAARIGLNTSSIPGGASAPYYLNTVSYAPQKAYSLTSPTGDPWYADKLLATDAPVSKTIDLLADNLIAGSVAPTLSVEVWGGSDLPGESPNDPDHHVSIQANGAQVGSLLFNGIRAQSFSTPLGFSSNNGALAIKVSVPNDLGYIFDLVNL
ncbi:MAG: carboxypeptidase regulatory-like domain-containing protein, partial [Methylococcales bacterium]|nr:carboxypeptidase regulatory-like domain-containing protein [Methylococcales bacterium]